MNAAPQVRNSVETELARYARSLATILRNFTPPSESSDQLAADLLTFAHAPTLDSRTNLLFDRAIAAISKQTAATAARSRFHSRRARATSALSRRMISWLSSIRLRRRYALPAPQIARIEHDIQAQLNVLSARVSAILRT